MDVRATRATEPVPCACSRCPMKIVAFDMSLTCAGWATDDACGTLQPPKGSDRGVARLAWLRAAVLDRAQGADAVAIEGYSYASTGRAIISLGELGGVIRLALADAGIPYAEIAPTTRALWACGKGNANKEAVLVEAVRRLGYAGHSNDEADALWLLTIARAHYGSGPAATNEAQRRALAAVEWPVVEGVR